MKRYCKGCEDDVTATMYCHCGEIALNESSTWTGDELDEREDAIEEAMSIVGETPCYCAVMGDMAPCSNCENLPAPN